MLLNGKLLNVILTLIAAHSNRQIVYGAVWAALFGCHVTYLSVLKFDYGYNMAASVAAGMQRELSNGLWLIVGNAGVLYAIVWFAWCVKVNDGYLPALVDGKFFLVAE